MQRNQQLMRQDISVIILALGVFGTTLPCAIPSPFPDNSVLSTSSDFDVPAPTSGCPDTSASSWMESPLPNPDSSLQPALVSGPTRSNANPPAVSVTAFESPLPDPDS